jgi:hypothetical protein
LWSDLCGSCFGLAKREALAGSRRENPKLIFPSCFGQGVTKRGMREGGGNLFFFFLVEIEKFLELFVLFLQKIFIFKNDKIISF